MKKILLIALVAVLCFGLTACFGSNEVKYTENTAFDKAISLPSGYAKTDGENGQVIFNDEKGASKLTISKYTDKSSQAIEIITEYAGTMAAADAAFIAPSKEGYSKNAKVYKTSDGKNNLIACYAKEGEAYLFSFVCESAAFSKHSEQYLKILGSFKA